MWEQHRLTKIFGPNKEKLTGKCRKLHKNRLHDLYYSRNIIQGHDIRKNEIGGTLDVWGRGEVQPWFWWENLRFGTPGYRCENNIKIYLKHGEAYNVFCVLVVNFNFLKV